MSDTCAPQGVALLGGEMLQWSDEESGRPGADGGVLAELVCSVVARGSRALVVGPHSTALVETLAARCASLRVVVRSMPDARALARTFADRPVVEVGCGGLERVAGGPYDVIVALDGLDRVLSADSPDLDWRARARLLARMLSEDGTLLVSLENDLGAHRLVGMADPEARRGSGEWQPAHGVDERRPVTPGQLAEALADAGLSWARGYAAHPEPARPAVVLSCDAGQPCDAGEGLPAGETLAAVLTAAYAECADVPVLADPRRLVRAAVRGELADRLAPAWIAVCGPAGPLPGTLVCSGRGEWAVTYELSDGRRQVRSGAMHGVGDVLRDPARLSLPMPLGPTLDELLRQACAQADLPQIRRLLQDYSGWLRKFAFDGMVDGSMVFATADNVVFDRDGWALADASWAWAAPVAYEHVLARSLRRFAVGLQVSGQDHPWPSILDTDRLCRTLHAMAAEPVSDAAIEQGLRLEAEIVAVLEGVGRERVLARIREPEFATSAIKAHRVLVAAHAKLGDDLRAARDRSDWAGRAVARWRSAADVARRERRKALRALKTVHASSSYRLGRLVTAPSRMVKRRRRKG